jgi:hypothetical protein
MEEEVLEKKYLIMLMRLRLEEHRLLLRRLCVLINKENSFLLRDLFKERISIGVRLFQGLRR